MSLNDNEKLRAFETKVIGEANEHAARIATEAYEQKESAIRARKTEIETRVRTQCRTAYETERERITADASRAALAQAKQYLCLRDEITDRVLSDTADMVARFPESEEYGDYLTALCTRVSDRIPCPFTIALNARDHARFAQACKAAAGEKCTEVVADDSIGCGGALFRAANGAMVVNQTLDENLTHAREELVRLMGNDLKVDN